MNWTYILWALLVGGIITNFIILYMIRQGKR